MTTRIEEDSNLVLRFIKSLIFISSQTRAQGGGQGGKFPPPLGLRKIRIQGKIKRKERKKKGKRRKKLKKREKGKQIQENCEILRKFIKFVHFTLIFSKSFLNKKLEEILLKSIQKSHQKHECLKVSNNIFRNLASTNYEISNLIKI